MITVRVFSREGRAQSGKEVKVHGAGVSSARTDSSGSANFDRLSSGRYDVYIDGKKVYSGAIVGVQVVHVDL